MALTIDPNDFVNKLLLVIPNYGWGWCRLDKPDPQPIEYREINDAGAFSARAMWFFHSQGELKGFCGLIEQDRHLLNALWIVCSTRSIGNFNFSDKPCLFYDFEIGPNEPKDQERPKITGSPLYSGYGQVKSTR